MTAGTDYDPSKEGATMNFDGRMSYGDYLCLDSVLGAQKTRTDAHDEMLFIIQHQTSELWMKLAIHEISAARAAIREDQLQPAMKTLARVSRIFEQLNSAWDVLRTMTPSDYTHFRAKLGQSSGFQSFQYRMIEFALGNRNHAMIRPHAHVPGVLAKLEAELAEPSLYDEVLRLAARRGIAMPGEVLARDVRVTHQVHDGVIAGWKIVYEAPEQHWALYEVAEKLVDLEDYFRRWRFNHVTTVERVIGLKRGTGGTGGTSYLKRMLDVELFPELWRVRTEL
ncbi:tryptophan 2,3-dioxygenase [Hoeflea sp. BAL378]|uniref:tryptophan 2,3-dioxygenase n=1 Tax=Hoeflea sp. BAL378 TaxID=1547437 RepID=UPI0005129AF7|nr:tryptophan 2,3-dioxygenase [Hoeflea sp. BAL378]KGF68879.1 tryptophan 2,3-dioxygenase [Hoeflea sp. BAL378]